MQRWRVRVRETIERSYYVYATEPGEAVEQLQEGIYVKVEDHNNGNVLEVLNVEDVTGEAE